VSNESGGLFTMRQTLRRWLGEHGAGEDEIEDVIMACNEACENAVEHGYGFGDDLFAVEFEYADGEVQVAVRDHGAWREPQVTPDRGRGLPLMRKLMDTVDVQPRPGGTTVRMSRRLATAAAPAGAGPGAQAQASAPS
jgi:anti-sigma regulatory factor (Ser/Thr protein kinase)